MEKKNKILNFLIVIILTMIVLYFSLKDNFTLIIDIIAKMNVFWFLISILLMVIYFAFRSLVNTFLARKFNSNYKFKKAFKMEFEIALFNAITPFCTGGKPYEIYALKKNNLKLTDATNVAIQNFIVYQIALILLGFFALIYNNIFEVIDNGNILLGLVYVGFFVNIVVIIFLFAISFAKKTNKRLFEFVIKCLDKLNIIKNKEEIIDKIDNYLVNFHNGAKILLKSKLQFLGFIGLQIISLVSFYLIPVVILYGIGDYSSFNFIESIIISAYVMLIGSFLPMPGGTGGLEYAFIVFFGSVLVGPKLNAMMVIWRFVTYYFGFILGLIIFNCHDKKESKF